MLKNTKDKFIDFLKNQELFILDNEERIRNSIVNSNVLVELECVYCGKINRKTMSGYMRGRGCTCQCTNTLKTTEQFKEELPEDIELLGEYKGAFENTLFRHKTCGFCWKAKPHNILSGKGCPKCNRKTSKGEQQIIKYLENNNIQYVHEYQIDVEGHKLRLDFYIPSLNLGIEYNGIQHYEPVKHFGGEERFKKQQYYDELKNKYYNIITIPYWELDNIENVLSLVFNDYPAKEQG